MPRNALAKSVGALSSEQSLAVRAVDPLLLFEPRSPTTAMQRLRSVVVAASKPGNCHEAAIGQASIEPSP
jgi:hypothetical protein